MMHTITRLGASLLEDDGEGENVASCSGEIERERLLNVQASGSTRVA